MAEAEVERRLGPPVATAEPSVTGSARHRPYRATLYAFADGPLVNAGRGRMRLAELRYEGGRLTAIDNDPGARIDGGACKSDPRRPSPLNAVELRAPAGPLLSFAGVKVGDPLLSLEHRFGRAPSGNASRDWYSYLPVPISFDVDPETTAIIGFAVATDDQALTTSILPRLHLRRDRTTCALSSIHFELSDGG